LNPRSFWDRYLRAYDALNQLGDYRAGLADAAGRMELRRGWLVLDAGSGTGNFSLDLERMGARAVSLDFSDVALRIHRRKHPAAAVLQASLEAPLPFGDAVFDAAACLSVLFTLSPPGAALALRELHRVLKPGGVLVVTAMKPGASKLRAGWRHLRSGRDGRTARERLVGLWRTVGPLLRVLYYNYRMYGLARRAAYRRLSSQQLTAAVAAAGFSEVRCASTYGGLFHLLRARRPERGSRIGPGILP
jgi:ubiquinone/menaquinone biosynthesis C-methylase UbiE